MKGIFGFGKNRQPDTPKGGRKAVSVWQWLLVLVFLNGWVFARSWSSFWILFALLAYLCLTRRVLPLKWHNRLAERLKVLERPLRAFHIRLIRGVRPPAFVSDSCQCLNCGMTFTGNFCPRCGQNRATTRYRFSNMLTNIAGGFFNIDNGFGRTIIDLLYRPGYLIADFIRGKRAPYFRPFQTLFVLAALYIMAVQLVDPGALKRFDAPDTPELRQEMDSLLTEISEDEGMEEEIPAWLTNENLEKLKSSLAGEAPLQQYIGGFLEVHPFLNNVAELLKSWAHGNKAFTILITLPLFAVASRLTFRNRKKFSPHYNLTEHIFVQAYIACQLLLLSILYLLLRGEANLTDYYELPAICCFLFFCMDYKQLYRLTWRRSIGRTTLMFCYSFLMVLLFATLVVTLSLIFMLG
ncbi:MAG: DUF3667 domain-containing protein [Parabacteroides sp.]